MRDSFFDEAIQAVLLKRHPDVIKAPAEDPQLIAHAVTAWTCADTFQTFGNGHAENNDVFLELMFRDPVWFCELVTAMEVWRRNKSEIARRKITELTTSQLLERWHAVYGVSETKRFYELDREDCYPVENTRIVRGKSHSKKVTATKRGAPPVPEIESVEKWPGVRAQLEKMTGKRFTDGNLRKIVSEEDARRRKIQEKWADSWTAYLNFIRKEIAAAGKFTSKAFTSERYKAVFAVDRSCYRNRTK
jgi:hypothetical protein